MRQNGHGAITIEDVRTWIEETGLCIFLPRSAQAGFTAPTFVEAVAGQRTTEPTLELIAAAEALLVRLEAEGVAVRLNLSGQPHNQSGDQPDYVVASWVLPYIYALRGDRDWRRSPQLTGSRQVSQLAVLAAKQLDSANMNAMQIRDALGREVTEAAVIRALHELWKQLRIIPVVGEVGVPALWQPLRQRFQKAIAEGASTSQVTAISVLASIYLQAVIAASMEDIELFLSPLTSRSKIREVVRGLAATRQVHTTNMGHMPMFYVAGTLPEFPVTTSFQIGNAYPGYRGSSYVGLDHDLVHEDEFPVAVEVSTTVVYAQATEEVPAIAAQAEEVEVPAHRKPLVDRAAIRAAQASHAAGKAPAKPVAPRPRASKAPAVARSASPVHPRERNRGAAGSGEARTGAGGDRRRVPAARGSNGFTSRSANGNGTRNGASAANGNGSSHHTNGHSNGNGKHASQFAKPASPAGNGHARKNDAKPAGAGWKARAAAPSQRNGNGAQATGSARPNANGRPGSPAAGRVPGKFQSAASSANGVKRSHAPGKPVATKQVATRPSNGNGTHSAAARSHSSEESNGRKPAPASASKRYSFAGQAKQAPKVAAGRTQKPASKAVAAAKGRSSASRPAPAKRRG